MFGTTPDFDVRKRYALSLLQQGMDSSPVRHPLAAVARALQGGIGGYLAGQAQQEDAASGAQMFNSLPGLGGSPMPQVAPQASAPVMPQNGVSNSGQPAFGDAIAKIESGGRYDALGPVTKTGDRAYGKYQVMGANIPQWTQTALGQPMTAQQFLASPEAQDAVFQKRFGGYVSKYGPEGAAKAWFAGEKGMNNPNARDQLGTTVDSYAKKFTGALGPQVANLSTGTPQNVPPQPQQQVAQATPRQQVQIPPEVAQTIRQLGADPRTRAQAWQLYLQYAKPTEQYRQGVDENGVPYQQNIVSGKIEADPRRDASIAEAEYARKNWQKLGFPDPASQDLGSKEFWRTYNAKRLGGPGTNVTVDNRGENEFSKEAGKLSAKRYNDIVDEGPKAKQMLSDVQTLQTLGGIIGTGKEAQVKATLGPYAEALGVKIDGLPEIQAYESIVNRVAPTLRVPGSGAQSDYELKNFLKALPTLGNTPEGNAIISRVTEGMSQNKLKAAEIASQAMHGEITRKEADKLLRELPDPMQEYREYVKKNPDGKVKVNPEGGYTVIDGVEIRKKN